MHADSSVCQEQQPAPNATPPTHTHTPSFPNSKANKIANKTRNALPNKIANKTRHAPPRHTQFFLTTTQNTTPTSHIYSISPKRWYQWCPIASNEQYLAVGTYQLVDAEGATPGDDTPKKRIGRLLLYRGHGLHTRCAGRASERARPGMGAVRLHCDFAHFVV